MRSLIAYFLQFLVPPRNTEKVLETLSLEKIRSFYKPTYLNERTYLLPYRIKEIEAFIWELKYYHTKKALNLGSILLAEELMGIISEELGKPLLMPIPMHKNRKKHAANQCELLCQRTLEQLSEVVEYRVALSRTRETPPQQGLPRTQRLRNAHHSMTAEPLVRGRICIVIDDVTTTGATFAEARRALAEAGAEKIYCIALAG